MIVDFDVLISVKHFILHGLDPGSFARCLIKNDRRGAYQKAHRNLLPLDSSDLNALDVVRNLLEIVQENLPEKCWETDQDLDSWTGTWDHNCSDDSRACILKLSGHLEFWDSL
jgi:hypothetical protein